MNVLGYTESGTIRVIFDGDENESIVPDDMANRHRQEIAAWQAAGNVIPSYVPPAPTIDDYCLAISSMMDEAAQSKQYDNAVSIATYVGSTNAKWAAEAQAFVAWRDEIWAYSYGELDKVQAGERAQPSVADFLAELTSKFPLNWPQAS